jgi:hypothetical protein
MDMTKFEYEDDPGFLAVAGELRRWSKQLTQPEVSGGLGIQQEHQGHLTNFGRSARATLGGQSPLENGGNAADQIGQQAIHGDLNINQSV